MHRRAGGVTGGASGVGGGHALVPIGGGDSSTPQLLEGDDDEPLDPSSKAKKALRRRRIFNARYFGAFMVLKGVTAIGLYLYVGHGPLQLLSRVFGANPTPPNLLSGVIVLPPRPPDRKGKTPSIAKDQAVQDHDRKDSSLLRSEEHNKVASVPKIERVAGGKVEENASPCYIGPNSDNSNRNTTLQWRELAINLAKLPVKELLLKLDKDDPFGVRKFEADLIKKELELDRTLTRDELRLLFPCPNRCLLTPELHPEALSAPTLFREQAKGRQQPPPPQSSGNETPYSWLFFQHLRKAGGTHFCSLARANLPAFAVAKYYCMPDYYWNHPESCAGCLTRFDNQFMSNEMRRAGHRIAGNEWDNFARRFLDVSTSVVFATSFRKPLDRALSQFRFECVEGRGCKELNVTRWWENRKDLYNVYTTTFADPPRNYHKLLTTYLEETDAEQAAKRGELMGQAFDVVVQLHLVLSMEWLAYAGSQVSAVLGFHNVSGLTQRVRPHIGQAQRKDAQDRNSLGAASITKASWDPQTYLSPDQYQRMSETLALDMVLTDAARRIFLERLVCP